MLQDSLKSRFLRPHRVTNTMRFGGYAAAVLLGAGALCARTLLGSSETAIALIGTFAVLISALLGGSIAGWLCLAITGVGFWFVEQPVGSGFSSSQLTVWSAYLALGSVLIEVIRRMQWERRRLLEHDQRLRLAGRAARIWFWEWDLKDNVLRWSRENESGDRKAQFYKFPMDEYIKQRVHPEDQHRILTALFEAAARNQRFELEYRILETDGTVHWLSTKGKIFENNGASVMLGMASEITTQKQATEVRSHYRAVLGSLTEGVCYANASGVVQYINGAAEQMLGYSPDEIHGRNFHELMHLDCRGHESSCCFFEALRAGSTCRIQEETFTTKSGDNLTVEYTAAPVIDGVALGVVITFRDISERKRAEAALQASERMAATGRMAATISHELRNPLDSLMQLLYLVRQSPRLNKDEQQHLELMEQELARMAEVAHQTLAMHRQSSSMVPVNLTKLIDGVLLLYSKKIRAGKIQINRQYDSQTEIPGFPAELRQVFTNLVVNAVEAMSQSGRLRIHVRNYREPVAQGREGVLVSLLDTGSGIPKNVREHLFEPFFSTKGEKGSGVGLWVSRGIMQRHQGRIRVHSNDRPGRSYTCFSVFLPLKQPHTLVPGAANQQQPLHENLPKPNAEAA